MTREEIMRQLRSHEDNFVERKLEGVKAAELRRTVSAFANSVEGREALLIVGVEDRTGQIIGVANTEKLQERIRNVCQEDCYPPVKCTIDVVGCDGLSVVAVVIPPSENKPHFTGPAFVRVGSASLKASKQQFDELVLSTNDKCREILRHKYKGLVTVREVGYHMDSKRHEARPWMGHRECQITDCTAHIVTLFEPATGRNYNEALKGVEISHDDEKWRLMLVVRGV